MPWPIQMFRIVSPLLYEQGVYRSFADLIPRFVVDVVSVMLSSVVLRRRHHHHCVHQS